MDWEEFDSSVSWRPFRKEDATRVEAESGRLTTLGVALWGRTSEQLQRQLSASYPEIPLGCNLADLRKLQQHVQSISAALANPRNTWLSPLALSSKDIFVGTQRLTTWEARCEVVRRAIEHLERR